MLRHIVVLALAVSLVAAKPHKFENTKQILAEVNKEAFGNSILSLVHLATMTGEPIDQINLLLQNLATNLNQQQTKSDQVHENDSATCEKLINDMESEIAYHQTQIVAVTKLREDTVAALAEAEKEVRQATKDLEQNQSTFDHETQTRAQQLATWTEKDAQHVDQIEAVDEASKIVQHLQAGVAFSQIKSRFEKVQTKLAEGKHALFKPLINALTQLATKVDNKAIIKILDLLSQIRQQLVQSRNQLRETEERQAANWVVQSAHLQEEKKRLIERKAFLEGSIINYKDVIQGATKSLEDHTIGLEDETEALRIQHVWCDIQERNYEEGTVERQRQLDVIERLQDILINKGSSATEFFQEREELF